MQKARASKRLDAVALLTSATCATSRAERPEIAEAQCARTVDAARNGKCQPTRAPGYGTVTVGVQVCTVPAGMPPPVPGTAEL